MSSPGSIGSLPLKEWPEADRVAWEAACRPAKRLVRGGAAGHLVPASQEDLANRYGLFLDFLDRTGRLDPGAEAGVQVTPEAIAPFVAELEARVSSVTLSRTIYKVRRTVECIAPHLDFAWLAEIGKDLALLERPKDDFARIVAPERLVEVGLTLIREAERDIRGNSLRRALVLRNGLMVALLTLCPIRLKNFASLTIGETFVSRDGEWWIVLEDTKSGRPDHRPVDHLLASCIGAYLNIYRPVLFAHASHRLDTPLEVPTALGMEKVSALWLGRHGRPLTYNAVERLITEITRMTIGVAVNPHRFRTSAATSAALHAPQSPHLGSALLQHSDPRVTQEHYIRASSLSVARDFTALIANLRRSRSRCG